MLVMRVHCYPTLSALLLMGHLISCGGAATKKTVSTRESGATGADATQLPAVVLAVTGDLTDGAVTNSNKHALSTALSIPNPIGVDVATLLSQFTVQMTLTGPSGASLPITDGNGNSLPGGTQTAVNANWQLLLSDNTGSSEGAYTLKIQATAAAGANTNVVQLPKSWSATVTLNVTQPVIGIQGTIATSLTDGSRTLNAHVWVANKTTATCSGAQLRTSDANASLPLTLSVDADSGFLSTVQAPAGSPQYLASNVSIPSALHDPFTIYAKCTDKAGNSAEYIQPIGVTTPNFLFGAVAQGPQGNVPGTSTNATYLQPGNVTVALNLLDTTSNQPLTAAFLQTVESLLKVTVTDAAPANLAALTAIQTPLWNQPFASSITFALPSGYDAAKTIYVSLTEQNVGSNTETLIGTVPLQLFVATTAPSIRWVSLPQFVPFAANVPISGQFAVTTSEAPLASTQPLVLEYSTDGSTWTALTATITSAGATTTTNEMAYNYTFNYPLTSEQPFRIHVKAKDLAGNTTSSATSSNLIGSPTLATTVTSAQRTGCAASGVAESKFTPWLASSVLCQQASALGTLSGPYYAQLLLQNQGSAPVLFYSTSQITPGMGYQVVADGVVVLQGRFMGPTTNNVVQPPAAFALTTTGLQLFDFTIQPSWLSASKVTINFDIEQTGANSIANSCYAAGTYPSVVIQDKANGLVPTQGPMGCDTVTTLAP